MRHENPSQFDMLGAPSAPFLTLPRLQTPAAPASAPAVCVQPSDPGTAGATLSGPGRHATPGMEPQANISGVAPPPQADGQTPGATLSDTGNAGQATQGTTPFGIAHRSLPATGGAEGGPASASPGLELVLAECRRQLEQLGHTPEADDERDLHQFSKAAGRLLMRQNETASLYRLEATLRDAVRLTAYQLALVESLCRRIAAIDAATS